MNRQVQISLPSVIGKGYKQFWNWKGRYRVVKGSRASKKSKTTALWFIYNMMKYKGANTIVVRKVYRTLKNSCYSDLKWACHRLQVDHLWDFKLSPLEAVYKPTGQRIIFTGLDDPLKVTSVAVDSGVLSWMWIEEAYEILQEEDFDMLDESIRGAIPDEFKGLFKQITITFNPWNERHWLKKRFFDQDDQETLALTTNYLMNEWLDKADLKVFNAMKQNNPRRYAVAGLGNWGIVDGLIYENWTEHKFQYITKADYQRLTEADKISNTYVIKDDLVSVHGLDFGYTNDPSAFFSGMLDIKNKKLYVDDEFYEKGLSNAKIYKKIVEMGFGKEKITADSAEPKSIDELNDLGLRRIKGAKKGKDSINNGIQWIQELEIIVHPRCVNFLTEISNYQWDKDKFGKKLNKAIDDFNHLMDAMRYALEDYIVEQKWLY